MLLKIILSDFPVVWDVVSLVHTTRQSKSSNCSHYTTSCLVSHSEVTHWKNFGQEESQTSWFDTSKMPGCSCEQLHQVSFNGLVQAVRTIFISILNSTAQLNYSCLASTEPFLLCLWSVRELIKPANDSKIRGKVV